MRQKYPQFSPFVYCANNPIKLVDPNGMEIYVEVEESSNGVYTVVGGTLNKDKNIYVVKNGERTGEILGQTFTKYSFFGNDGNIVVGATIDLNDMSGQNFLDDFMKNTPDLITYIFDEEKGGRINGNCDFKNIGNKGVNNISQYHNRGMRINTGDGVKIATARDIGDFAAGYIAGKNGIPKLSTRIAFDIYQGGIEPNVTKMAENIGYRKGKNTYYLNNANMSWK